MQNILPRPRVIYARHGESVFNKYEGDSPFLSENSPLRHIADHQIPLTPKGARQAEGLGLFLAEHTGGQIDVAIDSGLRRAKQTKSIVLDCFPNQSNILQISMPTTRERVSGYLNRSKEHQRVSIPYWDILEEEFKSNPVHVVPIGGETLISVVDRLLSFELFLWLSFPGKTVVCFCHGNVIRAREILHQSITLSISLEEANNYLKTYFPGNCVVHEYNPSANGLYKLEKHNPIEPPYGPESCW